MRPRRAALQVEVACLVQIGELAAPCRLQAARRARVGVVERGAAVGRSRDASAIDAARDDARSRSGLSRRDRRPPLAIEQHARRSETTISIAPGGSRIDRFARERGSSARVRSAGRRSASRLAPARSASRSTLLAPPARRARLPRSSCATRTRARSRAAASAASSPLGAAGQPAASPVMRASVCIGIARRWPPPLRRRRREWRRGARRGCRGASCQSPGLVADSGRTTITGGPLRRRAAAIDRGGATRRSMATRSPAPTAGRHRPAPATTPIRVGRRIARRDLDAREREAGQPRCDRGRPITSLIAGIRGS